MKYYRCKKMDLLYYNYYEKTILDKTEEIIWSHNLKAELDKVEKWGELFLIIFIGIPLPGSGVYSGALAGYIMGISFKKFMIANIFGVLIAAILVTIVTLTGSEAFQFFIKEIK